MPPATGEYDMDQFSEVVERAFRRLPREFRSAVDNVEVCLENHPPASTLKKLRIECGGILLGLFEGVPRPHRPFGGVSPPSRITLFLASAHRLARTTGELERILAETLYHELGHYFGMGEGELRR